MITWYIYNSENYNSLKKNIERKTKIEYIFDESTFSFDSSFALLSARSLFDDTHKKIPVVLYKDIFGAYGDEFLDFIVSHKDTADIYIFEEVLSVSQKKHIETISGQIIQIAQPIKQKKDQSLSPFVFTDTLGTYNKKIIWTAYHDAIREGLSVEEIVPAVLWYLKTVFLIQKGETKTISPFVLKKISLSVKTKDSEHTKALYKNLIELYYSSRDPRALPLVDLFEEWILRSY